MRSAPRRQTQKPRPFGHYFILEKIAQGGMAEIFKGLTYDFSGIKKFIVIKRILPHIAANPAFVEMLIAEAKIAVQLSHGNIAQVFDLGKVGNDYFIVMEYVDGKSLSQILKRCRDKEVQIPIEYCVYIIAELMSGLDYIHRKKDEKGTDLKIIHRDISPQNVMVSPSGNVKIVDFGVAKAAMKLKEADTGALKGKFAYMSPEQTLGDEVDSRSDLFSAGIVLWELLVCQRLFKKGNSSETMQAVREMTPLPPSELRSEIREELNAIVLKALSKNPDERYPSAHDFNQALIRYLYQNFSNFKIASVGQFLNELFEGVEEGEMESDTERTAREETIMEPTLLTQQGILKGENADWAAKEETQIVNPLEIDFHSIFEEISWKEKDEDQTRTLLEGNDSAVSISEKPNFDEISVTSYLPLTLDLPPKPPLWSKRWFRFVLFLTGFIAIILAVLLMLKSS